MGLAVGPGVFASLKTIDSEGEAWMRKQIAQLNMVLAKNGLARHEEPEVVSLPTRRAITSFSFLNVEVYNTLGLNDCPAEVRSPLLPAKSQPRPLACFVSNQQ